MARMIKVFGNTYINVDLIQEIVINSAAATIGITMINGDPYTAGYQSSTDAKRRLDEMLKLINNPGVTVGSGGTRNV